MPSTHETNHPNHILETMSHTSRLVATEIQNANQLLNGVIESVITTKRIEPF